MNSAEDALAARRRTLYAPSAWSGFRGAPLVTGILRDATVFGVRSRESQPNSPENAASNLLNSARVPRSRSAGVSRPSK